MSVKVVVSVVPFSAIRCHLHGVECSRRRGINCYSWRSDVVQPQVSVAQVWDKFDQSGRLTHEATRESLGPCWSQCSLLFRELGSRASSGGLAVEWRSPYSRHSSLMLRTPASPSGSAGLHTSEAIKEGEDFFGRSVILAARDRVPGSWRAHSGVVAVEGARGEQRRLRVRRRPRDGTHRAKRNSSGVRGQPAPHDRACAKTGSSARLPGRGCTGRENKWLIPEGSIRWNECRVSRKNPLISSSSPIRNSRAPLYNVNRWR